MAALGVLLVISLAFSLRAEDQASKLKEQTIMKVALAGIILIGVLWAIVTFVL